MAYIHVYGVGVTAVIHGTELMQFGKVTLRSTKNQLKVTLTSQSDFKSY
jgi:hypothetical protein